MEFSPLRISSRSVRAFVRCLNSRKDVTVEEISSSKTLSIYKRIQKKTSSYFDELETCPTCKSSYGSKWNDQGMTKNFEEKYKQKDLELLEAKVEIEELRTENIAFLSEMQRLSKENSEFKDLQEQINQIELLYSSTDNQEEEFLANSILYQINSNPKQFCSLKEKLEFILHSVKSK